MAEQLPPGTRVEVRNGFDRSWARGFEVVRTDTEYGVRRLSDGAVLPGTFPPVDVRPEQAGSSPY